MVTLSLAENTDFDLTQTFGQDKIPISSQPNLWIGQNHPIQLAVFGTPQLSQYLELEAHLWTGPLVLFQLYESIDKAE